MESGGFEATRSITPKTTTRQANQNLMKYRYPNTKIEITPIQMGCVLIIAVASPAGMMETE